VALLLATWFVAINVAQGPFPLVARQVRGSAIIRGLDEVLPDPPSVAGGVRRFLDRFGFPEVFAGLPVAPAGPVDPPSDAQANRAFRAAEASTVQIVGEACGRIQEGSGFVAAERYVITNAHVVAGVDSPQVIDRDGDVQDAVAVLFDPRLDVALLRIPEPAGPVLDLAEPVDRGARGAVLGYPEGRGLTGEAAAVRRSLSAIGRDIYGEDHVIREVYELQAEVRPGNSGGPFVLVNGDVAGVVFAASSTDEHVGYALTAAEMEPLVDRAVAGASPTGTGTCIR